MIIDKSSWKRKFVWLFYKFFSQRILELLTHVEKKFERCESIFDMMLNLWKLSFIATVVRLKSSIFRRYFQVCFIKSYEQSRDEKLAMLLPCRVKTLIEINFRLKQSFSELNIHYGKKIIKNINYLFLCFFPKQRF